jgi:hypothetical protein
VPDLKSKPEDWDDEVQGEWEAPMIANPRCQNAPGCGEYRAPRIANPKWKGEWVPPRIKNPRWKGVWRPRQLPNPDWYEDADPYSRLKPITGAGFEIWVVTKDIGFGNVYIGTDEAALREWNDEHFAPKHLKQQFEEKLLDQAGPSKIPEVGVVVTSASLRREGEGVWGALADFVMNCADAWNSLYHENAPATIVITTIVLMSPVLLFAFCAFREDSDHEEEEPRLRRPTPEKMQCRNVQRASGATEGQIVHRTPARGDIDAR